MADGHLLAPASALVRRIGVARQIRVPIATLVFVHRDDDAETARPHSNLTEAMLYPSVQFFPCSGEQWPHLSRELNLRDALVRCHGHRFEFHTMPCSLRRLRDGL